MLVGPPMGTIPDPAGETAPPVPALTVSSAPKFAWIVASPPVTVTVVVELFGPAKLAVPVPPVCVQLTNVLPAAGSATMLVATPLMTVTLLEDGVVMDPPLPA